MSIDVPVGRSCFVAFGLRRRRPVIWFDDPHRGYMVLGGFYSPQRTNQFVCVQIRFDPPLTVPTYEDLVIVEYNEQGVVVRPIEEPIHPHSYSSSDTGDYSRLDLGDFILLASGALLRDTRIAHLSTSDRCLLLASYPQVTRHYAEVTVAKAAMAGVFVADARHKAIFTRQLKDSIRYKGSPLPRHPDHGALDGWLIGFLTDVLSSPEPVW